MRKSTKNVLVELILGHLRYQQITQIVLKKLEIGKIKEEQIEETPQKPQRIVIQRSLSRLQ